MKNKIIKKESESNLDQMEFIFHGKGLDIDLPKYYISKSVQFELERIPEVGIRMKNMILHILHVPGIESLCIQSKYISIKKAKAFDWDWIEPRLRKLFERYELGDASLLLNINSGIELRIIIDEQERNSQRRTYHTTALISEADDELFEQWLWNHDKMRDEDDLFKSSSPTRRIGKRGISILNEIFKKNEINKIWIKPYTLKVEKTGSAEWDSIDGTVFDAITKNIN